MSPDTRRNLLHLIDHRGSADDQARQDFRAFSVPSTKKQKKTWRYREVFDLTTEFGRRDWTRTNDPHHVKVGNPDAKGSLWTQFS